MIRVRFREETRDFSLFHSVQIEYRTHPASYSNDETGSVLGSKTVTHPHLVPKSRTVELRLHSSIYLHIIVLFKLIDNSDFSVNTI
jgi:hypothetical protein